MIGENKMDFSVFDTSKLDEYAKEAKSKWGNTAAYGEFVEKSKCRSKETDEAIANGLMMIFSDFGKIKDTSPSSDSAQGLVKRLQSYITEHYYNCTKEILASLGKMYAGNEAFTQNIDAAGGAGTAQFAGAAIEIYCR